MNWGASYPRGILLLLVILASLVLTSVPTCLGAPLATYFPAEPAPPPSSLPWPYGTGVPSAMGTGVAVDGKKTYDQKQAGRKMSEGSSVVESLQTIQRDVQREEENAEQGENESAETGASYAWYSSSGAGKYLETPPKIEESEDSDEENREEGGDSSSEEDSESIESEENHENEEEDDEKDEKDEVNEKEEKNDEDENKEEEEDEEKKKQKKDENKISGDEDRNKIKEEDAKRSVSSSITHPHFTISSSVTSSRTVASPARETLNAHFRAGERDYTKKSGRHETNVARSNVRAQLKRERQISRDRANKHAVTTKPEKNKEEIGVNDSAAPPFFSAATHSRGKSVSANFVKSMVSSSLSAQKKQEKAQGEEQKNLEKEQEKEKEHETEQENQEKEQDKNKKEKQEKDKNARRREGSRESSTSASHLSQKRDQNHPFFTVSSHRTLANRTAFEEADKTTSYAFSSGSSSGVYGYGRKAEKTEEIEGEEEEGEQDEQEKGKDSEEESNENEEEGEEDESSEENESPTFIIINNSKNYKQQNKHNTHEQSSDSGEHLLFLPVVNADEGSFYKISALSSQFSKSGQPLQFEYKALSDDVKGYVTRLNHEEAPLFISEISKLLRKSDSEESNDSLRDSGPYSHFTAATNTRGNLKSFMKTSSSGSNVQLEANTRDNSKSPTKTLSFGSNVQLKTNTRDNSKSTTKILSSRSNGQPTLAKNPPLPVPSHFNVYGHQYQRYSGNSDRKAINENIKKHSDRDVEVSASRAAKTTRKDTVFNQEPVAVVVKPEAIVPVRHESLITPLPVRTVSIKTTSQLTDEEVQRITNSYAHFFNEFSKTKSSTNALSNKERSRSNHQSTSLSDNVSAESHTAVRVITPQATSLRTAQTTNRQPIPLGGDNSEHPQEIVQVQHIPHGDIREGVNSKEVHHFSQQHNSLNSNQDTENLLKKETKVQINQVTQAQIDQVIPDIVLSVDLSAMPFEALLPSQISQSTRQIQFTKKDLPNEERVPVSHVSFTSNKEHILPSEYFLPKIALSNVLDPSSAATVIRLPDVASPSVHLSASQTIQMQQDHPSSPVPFESMTGQRHANFAAQAKPVKAGLRHRVTLQNGHFGVPESRIPEHEQGEILFEKDQLTQLPGEPLASSAGTLAISENIGELSHAGKDEEILTDTKSEFPIISPDEEHQATSSGFSLTSENIPFNNVFNLPAFAEPLGELSFERQQLGRGRADVHLTPIGNDQLQTIGDQLGLAKKLKTEHRKDLHNAGKEQKSESGVPRGKSLSNIEIESAPDDRSKPADEQVIRQKLQKEFRTRLLDMIMKDAESSTILGEKLVHHGSQGHGGQESSSSHNTEVPAKLQEQQEFSTNVQSQHHSQVTKHFSPIEKKIGTVALNSSQLKEEKSETHEMTRDLLQKRFNARLRQMIMNRSHLMPPDKGKTDLERDGGLIQSKDISSKHNEQESNARAVVTAREIMQQRLKERLKQMIINRTRFNDLMEKTQQPTVSVGNSLKLTAAENLSPIDVILNEELISILIEPTELSESKSEQDDFIGSQVPLLTEEAASLRQSIKTVKPTVNTDSQPKSRAADKTDGRQQNEQSEREIIQQEFNVLLKQMISNQTRQSQEPSHNQEAAENTAEQKSVDEPNKDEQLPQSILKVEAISDLTNTEGNSSQTVGEAFPEPSIARDPAVIRPDLVVAEGGSSQVKDLSSSNKEIDLAREIMQRRFNARLNQMIINRALLNDFLAPAKRTSIEAAQTPTVPVNDEIKLTVVEDDAPISETLDKVPKNISTTELISQFASTLTLIEATELPEISTEEITSLKQIVQTQAEPTFNQDSQSNTHAIEEMAGHQEKVQSSRENIQNEFNARFREMIKNQSRISELAANNDQIDNNTLQHETVHTQNNLGRPFSIRTSESKSNLTDNLESPEKTASAVFQKNFLNNTTDDVNGKVLPVKTGVEGITITVPSSFNGQFQIPSLREQVASLRERVQTQAKSATSKQAAVLVETSKGIESHFTDENHPREIIQKDFNARLKEMIDNQTQILGLSMPKSDLATLPEEREIAEPHGPRTVSTTQSATESQGRTSQSGAIFTHAPRSGLRDQVASLKMRVQAEAKTAASQEEPLIGDTTEATESQTEGNEKLQKRMQKDFSIKLQNMIANQTRVMELSTQKSETKRIQAQEEISHSLESHLDQSIKLSGNQNNILSGETENLLQVSKFQNKTIHTSMNNNEQLLMQDKIPTGQDVEAVTKSPSNRGNAEIIRVPGRQVFISQDEPFVIIDMQDLNPSQLNLGKSLSDQNAFSMTKAKEIKTETQIRGDHPVKEQITASQGFQQVQFTQLPSPVSAPTQFIVNTPNHSQRQEFVQSAPGQLRPTPSVSVGQQGLNISRGRQIFRSQINDSNKSHVVHRRLKTGGKISNQQLRPKITKTTRVHSLNSAPIAHRPVDTASKTSNQQIRQNNPKTIRVQSSLTQQTQSNNSLSTVVVRSKSGRFYIVPKTFLEELSDSTAMNTRPKRLEQARNLLEELFAIMQQKSPAQRARPAMRARQVRENRRLHHITTRSAGDSIAFETERISSILPTKNINKFARSVNRM